MNKLNKKLSKKVNIAVALMLFFAMGAFVTVNYALASNTATQSGSTGSAATISVVGKVADTGVTTITFPEGAPGATISVPYNNVDTDTDPQVLHASTSEPVVRLKNTAGVTYLVTLAITNWTNGVAASEDYELVATGTINIEAVAQVLSSDGNANSVATSVSMATGTYQALYLELALSAVVGKTGTSTLTILGESA